MTTDAMRTPEAQPPTASQAGAGGATEPVTVVVRRRVKAGCEPAFEELMKGIHRAAQDFPGYLGRDVIHSPAAGGFSEYTIIFRFDSELHLLVWQESAERREWLQRMAGIVVAETPHQRLSGLETWFSLPGGGIVTPPARYKMALVTWIAVFPLATLLQYLSMPVLGDVPAAIRALAMTALLVPLMTYVVMPRMTRLFRRWLYPEVGA
jgi:hypothetical protein